VSKTDFINRETAARQVANVLRRRIFSGEIPEGQYIRQEAIAQELGVSRLPVREALVLLETQGLVLNVKYKGALVTSLSPGEIQEIYALRVLLESFLLEHAFAHMDDAVFARAEAIIERSSRVKSSEEWAELNWQFHKTLYEPARLDLTLKTLEQVLGRSDRYFRLQRTVSRQLRTATDKQHRQVVALLREGRRNEALSAMREHIEWNAKDLTRVVKSMKHEAAHAR